MWGNIHDCCTLLVDSCHMVLQMLTLSHAAFPIYLIFKGIVSPDWKDLQMVSLDRFEV
jgi:hypothetical protein